MINPASAISIAVLIVEADLIILVLADLICYLS